MSSEWKTFRAVNIFVAAFHMYIFLNFERDTSTWGVESVDIVLIYINIFSYSSVPLLILET